MEKHRVIEPYRLAGDRMNLYRFSNASGLQSIAVPNALDARARTIPFNSVLVVSLENRLPREAKPVPEVSNIHHVLPSKLFPHSGAYPLKKAARVGYRSLASLFRGRLTIEVDLERPRPLIRILAMEKDRLLRRILSRGIYVSANGCARRRSFDVGQRLPRNSYDKLLKFSRGSNVKTAE